jgi:hypothetical protein
MSEEDELRRINPLSLRWILELVEEEGEGAVSPVLLLPPPPTPSADLEIRREPARGEWVYMGRGGGASNVSTNPNR